MTDQPTAPPATVPPDTDPVWRRLVMDCAAYQRAYPTPAHLAELVRQTAWLAFVRGMRYQQQTNEAQPKPPPGEWIVADVMNHAATHATDKRMSATAALAHAGQRERAARHARTETPVAGDETNGGNCGG